MASPDWGRGDANGYQVLALTPGGSTGFEASKQGHFSRCTGHQSDAESLGLNRLVDFSDRHAITVLEDLSDLLVAFVVPYRYSTTGT